MSTYVSLRHKRQRPPIVTRGRQSKRSKPNLGAPDREVVGSADTQDGEEEEVLTPSKFDRREWTSTCMRVATENSKDYQRVVEALDYMAGDSWRALPIEERLDLIAMQIRGYVGEGERVPLMLEPFRTDLKFTFHESTTGLDKATWITGVSPEKMQTDDGELNAVIQKLYWKKLKLSKSIRQVEDDLGEIYYKRAIKGVKLNEQTAFTALTALLSGCEDLIVSDINLLNFKCLVLATQNRPRGPSGHTLILSGSSPLSDQELRAQGETARSLWDQLLITISAALDMHVNLIVEVLNDDSIDKTWRDALVLTTKHIPAAIARKDRWAALKFDVRLAGIQFLTAPDLEGAAAPLRLLFLATAEWLRAMLTEVYKAPTRVTSRMRTVRDKSDAAAFPVFDRKFLEAYWRILEVWKRTWDTKWRHCRSKYSKPLSIKQRKHEIENSEREEAEFGDPVGDLCASFSGQVRIKKTTAAHGWGRFRRFTLPRSLGIDSSTFNSCKNCKRAKCLKCTIVKLTALLSDASKHAKACGAPFLKSLSETVLGDTIPVALPAYIESAAL